MGIQYCFRERRTYRILIVEESKLTSIDTVSPMTINQGIERCHFLYSKVLTMRARNSLLFLCLKGGKEFL